MEFINLISKYLKERKISIFCGAGISYNSGLPIVSMFLDYLFSKLDLTPSQKKKIISSNLPFESIMETVLRESALDEIIDIFSGGIPNASHIFIAKLARKGFLKTICTTNFDILIENALEKEGLVLGKDFRVYATEQDFNSIQWDDNIVHLIKIHGCVRQREEMAITLSLIASDKYSYARKNVMQNIFGNEHSHVMVLGYSCSDFDLIPIIKSMEGRKSNILFIDHQNDFRYKMRSESVAQRVHQNPFRSYEGLRVFANTDELIKTTWSYLLEDVYFNIRVICITWKDNIDRWYNDAVEASGWGAKHHISARLLYSIGAYKEAITHNKEAVSIALNDNNLLAYSSELGNMAMAFNAVQNYEQAKFCLYESITLCRRTGNFQGLSSQLQALGRMHHLLHENEEAVKIYEEALHYAELENDQHAISTVLGNISNCYNDLGWYDKALNSLNKALVLSRNQGNKQSESSQLGIVAQTYFSLSNYRKAIDCCNAGIKIKRAIGDRNGECILLCNLISIYRESGMQLEAKETANRCLELSRELGNKEIELTVKINLAIL